MFGHLFSMLTLIVIAIYLQGDDKASNKNNNIIRMTLIVLSSAFSMHYFINGVLSIRSDFSLVTLFMIEYGLLFVFTTYKLTISNKGNAYHLTYRILKKRLNHEIEYDDKKTIDHLIKDVMICLEDDDFENANRLLGKVELQYAADPNIEFLKMIVNQSLNKKEGDYEHSLCY